MSRDLTKAAPVLQEFIPKLKTWYEGRNEGKTLLVIHVDRTPAEQLRLFCQGRLPEFKGQRVTDKDGYNMLSKHNASPAKAVDVAVVDRGEISWVEEYYKDIGLGIFELGYSGELRWGGSWRDWGHIEER